jgi:SH3-like domain-containing protein
MREWYGLKEKKMNIKTLPILMLIFALSACAPASGTPTQQQPFVTETPTLFLGSPIPPLNTPAPGNATLTPAPASPAPIASFTPLSQSTQPTPGGSSIPYAVILVPEGDVLNIRSGPGVNNAVVGTLEPATSGLVRTGKTTPVGTDLWVEVQNPEGGTGWVNSNFLTEEVSSSAFCSDARVTALIQNLASSVKGTNDDMLAALVHSRHGLDARLWRYGTVANYTTEEASWMFESEYEVNWGPAPGSGEDAVGTFSEELLPKLQEVFNANYTTHCNDPLDLATFSVEPWPLEYENINYYTVFKPGSEQYGGLDWRAWTVGVEYVEGKPYLFSLIHYQWEP